MNWDGGWGLDWGNLCDTRSSSSSSALVFSGFKSLFSGLMSVVALTSLLMLELSLVVGFGGRFSTRGGGSSSNVSLDSSILRACLVEEDGGGALPIDSCLRRSRDDCKRSSSPSIWPFRSKIEFSISSKKSKSKHLPQIQSNRSCCYCH